MQIQENVPVGRKTTMRIGGTARYFAELKTKQDTEEALAFVQEKKIPLILLGGGSNTIFADGVINALIAQAKGEQVVIDGNTVKVEAGKYLPTLINELAAKDLDLSPLTGILGTMGGAAFGNAGQGPTGVWLDTYIENVTVFMDGQWKTLSRSECAFRYRESMFKDHPTPVIIWEMTLQVPNKPAADVKAEVERLLKKRIETQPHLKTAGSCFKAVGSTPAWQLIDKVGLRGSKVGDVQIAEKHANFLLNTGKASYADAKAMVKKVQEAIPSEQLEVEMRFVEEDGSLAF